MNIIEELYKLQDLKYRDFSASLIPNIEKERFIGVRTPDLRKLAKEIGEDETFLNSLPHKYMEENQLHAFILSNIKDYDKCIKRVEDFLPFVDNWATSDQLSPKCFKKNKENLHKLIEKWVKDDKTYTIRFGVRMLMQHFLDEDFKEDDFKLVRDIRSEEYYVNMMRAWYFATALTKQYESAVIVIQEQKLDKWTHNKAIQKAVESYRVTEEHKTYLKTLKIK